MKSFVKVFGDSAAASGLFCQNQLLTLQLFDLALVSADDRWAIRFDDSVEKLPDLLFGRDHFRFEHGGFLLPGFGALVPAQTQETREQFNKFMAGRERLQQRFIRIFDLRTRDRLTELLTAAMATNVIGEFLVPPLNPIRRHGMIALATGHEAPHREISIYVNACRRIGFTGEAFLIALECFQRDHPFVLPLAERHVPHLAFHISGIDGIGQNAAGLLVGEKSMAADWKTSMAFHESFHFSTGAKTPGGITVQRLPNDRSNRFNADKDGATGWTFLIAIPYRGMKHPEAAEQPPPHAILGLFSILAPMLTGECRFHNFKEVVIGIAGINAPRRFQLAANR